MKRTIALARSRAGWRDASGQAFTEYVVVTGMLVLLGMTMTGILSSGLWTFVRNAVQAVRTVAP